MSGQQIAFHAISKELQRALALLARRHALPLLLQALRNPLWQHLTLHRLGGHGHAPLLQG